MHISSPLRRRMVLLIYKDWTKLNTVGPGEVRCAKWRRKSGSWIDWTLMNTLYKVSHSSCSQNTKHKKLRVWKTQDYFYKQELLCNLIRQFNVCVVCKLSVWYISVYLQVGYAVIFFCLMVCMTFVSQNRTRTLTSPEANIKFIPSKTVLVQSFSLIMLEISWRNYRYQVLFASPKLSCPDCQQDT